MRASEERNAFLVRFSDAVRGLSDPALVAEETCRILTEQLGTERTLWAVMDWEAREYVSDWVFYADGTTAEPSRWPFDEREPFAAEHLAGRPVVYEDVVLDPRIPDPVKAAMVERGLLAGIAVPVLVGGRLVAILNTSQGIAPRRWTAEEVAFVEALAKRAWSEIERTRIEAGLRESEQKYRTLFESIDEGFCLLEYVDDPQRSLDYRFVEVNAAFEKQTGLTGVVGKLRSEVSPNTEDYWIGTYAEVARTGVARRVESHHEETGRWYDVFISRVGGEGSRQICLVFNDTTERKRAEEVLREREERQGFLLELGDAMRSQTSAEGVVETAARLLGLRLNASRVAFGEFDDEHDLVHIRRSWTADGAETHPAILRQSDFVGPLLDDLRAGRTVRFDTLGPRPRFQPERLAQGLQVAPPRVPVELRVEGLSLPAALFLQGEPAVVLGEGGLGRGDGVDRYRVALRRVFPAHELDRAPAPLDRPPGIARIVERRLRQPEGTGIPRRVSLTEPEDARASAGAHVTKAAPREAERREGDGRPEGRGDRSGRLRGAPGRGDGGRQDREDDPGGSEDEESEGEHGSGLSRVGNEGKVPPRRQDSQDVVELQNALKVGGSEPPSMT